MNTKRILSYLIAVIMIFSSTTLSVFAADYSNEHTEYEDSVVASRDEDFTTGDNSIDTDDEADVTDDDYASDDDIIDTDSQSTPDETPPRIMGDADNNGVVNVRDATSVQKHISSLITLDELSQIYADVDLNGNVNIKDATCIQKYVAGIVTHSSTGYLYDPNPETFRYYFYMPSDWLNEYTEKTGNTAGIYWWEGTNAQNAWPGIPAKKADMEGVYYYDVPTDVTTIVWNNYLDGGIDKEQPVYFMASQTVNIPTEYYDPGESELYPNGTENFDGMIYVTEHEQISPCCDFNGKMQCRGEWFYYYGKGEYGTAPKRGDSKILSGETVNLSALCDDNSPTETNRYYFYMPDEWLNESTATTGNTAGIYWWEGTDAQAFYPGLKAQKTDVDGVFYYDVPKDVSDIKWNNYFDGGSDVTQPYFADSIDTFEISLQGYKAGENSTYPEGIDSFDGMIFVTDFSKYDYNEYTAKLCFYGEWFYYYGGGEYGTTPVRGESEILTDSVLNRGHFVADSLPL